MWHASWELDDGYAASTLGHSSVGLTRDSSRTIGHVPNITKVNSYATGRTEASEIKIAHNDSEVTGLERTLLVGGLWPEGRSRRHTHA
ncbi:hypothetical protein AB1N83_007738 [Pleurotus pulmonarius]